MSDEVTGFDAPESSVENAAGLIESLLNPKKEVEASAEVEPKTQAEEPAPEPETRRGKNPLQTQTEAEEVPQADLEGEAIEISPAIEPSQPKPDPAQDQRIQAAEAKTAEAEAARNQHVKAVEALTYQLQTAMAGEFGDIKTHQDLLRVAQEDPLRYNRYVIHNSQLQAVQAEKAKLDGEQQKLNNQRFTEWQQAEIKKLPDLIPELKDEAKAPALVAKLRAFALSKGYTDQQLRGASASDFATLNDAMNFRDMKAAQIQAAKKAANAPPVQKPGAARQTDGKAETARTDFNRLRKTGSVNDAANVFKSILG